MHHMSNLILKALTVMRPCEEPGGPVRRVTREAYPWSLLGGSPGASSLLFMSVKYDITKINFKCITSTNHHYV